MSVMVLALLPAGCNLDHFRHVRPSCRTPWHRSSPGFTSPHPREANHARRLKFHHYGVGGLGVYGRGKSTAVARRVA
jgi:hypothetical protein